MGIFDDIRNRKDGAAAAKVAQLVKEGQALQHQGRYDDARAPFQEAIKLDENAADAYYGLARCHYERARAENQQAKGNIYFRAGLDDLDRAITAYERLVKLQPRAADGRLGLATAYDNRGRLDDAQREYEAAIQLDPDGMDGADAHFNLALLLYMRVLGLAGLREFPAMLQIPIGDPAIEPAFEVARKGIAIGQQFASERSYIPNLVNQHRRLAQWYDRFRQGSRAIEQYQAVLGFVPDDHEAREWLKLAERNTGRKLLP